jgi:hypothetical protein
MPIRTRELCHESLKFAITERLLPGFKKSGRYIVQREFKGGHTIDQDIKIIAHYAAAEGPLFADERAWRQAKDLVAAFTRKEASGFNRRKWPLPRLFGPVDGIAPGDLLAQSEAALLRFGFVTIDRNDRSFTAAFSSADSCTVMDLPEPYGKWLQWEGKPRWKQDIELEVDLRCQFFSEDAQGGSPDAFESFVSVEVSALAAPLFVVLERELAGLLHIERITGTDDPAKFRQRLTAALRKEINRL